MSGVHWTDRLSEYLDDDLALRERRELEAHLATCAECSDVLKELEAVVARAQTLKDVPPEKDLWESISRSIASVAQEDDQVIDLSARLSRVDALEMDGRVRLSVSQLVAASLAMIIASGSMAWALRPLAAGPESPEATSGSAALVQASLSAEVGESYVEDLARLEELVEEHRSELEPNTIRILEKNLAIIDRAIEESAAALLADPSDQYLREHLSRSVRRKVDYLRDASEISGWSS
jgi:anti-sigma factor RsiW